jgi:REP element-mobilizing transposase RayT
MTAGGDASSSPGPRPHGSLGSVHKKWHTRGYLPHFDVAQVCQAITYRLIDSVPAPVIVGFQRQVTSETDDARQGALRRLIEAYADSGHGNCVLRNEEAARIVVDSWKDTDDVDCEIHAAVVMPNHVHLLIRQWEARPLHALVTRWKSQSARLINRHLGRRGPLWMPDYWDRFIRDEDHWRRALEYIRMNPVRAGLVAKSEDWPWRI